MPSALSGAKNVCEKYFNSLKVIITYKCIAGLADIVWGGVPTCNSNPRRVEPLGSLTSVTGKAITEPLQG